MIKLFAPRTPTFERRRQIVEATLRLLGSTPIESLTTRDLAAELGLTQPALFRHFENREALLVGVVGHARDELEKIAVGILERGGAATAQLEALGMAVLEHAERHPGLPRLLFSSTPSAGPVRDALRLVVSMQSSLIAEIVRQGQRENDLAATYEAEHAATMYLGMIQGLILRWEIGGRSEPLTALFPKLFTLWLHGVGVVEKKDRKKNQPAPATAPSSMLVALDVRPLLAGGTDPLATILATLEAMVPTSVLVIEAPFRPAPLLALLTRRGHSVHAESLTPEHWIVEVVIAGAPPIEDLRDLEPPEPLERVLAACAALPSRGVYLARLPRFPRMLVPQLRKRGLTFTLLERSDGAALLRVEKPA